MTFPISSGVQQEYGYCSEYCCRVWVKSSTGPSSRNSTFGFFLRIQPPTIPNSLVILPKTGRQVCEVLEKLTKQQMRPAIVDTTMVPAPRRCMPNNPNSSINRRVVEDKKESTDIAKFHLMRIFRETRKFSTLQDLRVINIHHLHSPSQEKFGVQIGI